MKVVMRRIDEVRPYSANPRCNDDAVEAVAASIREYGFRQPIVVDGEGIIIVGHTRYKAALKLGMKKVPVHIARDLTPEQARAYRLADNQTASIATWNDELLVLELLELQKANFDLNLTGFNAEELKELLAPAPTQGLTDPDAVPEPAEETITQPGDLWVLGRHRLLCGDATKCEDSAALMNGSNADMLLTDPPYNVGYKGKTDDELTIVNDEMDDDSYLKFLVSAFSAASPHLNPGSAFYIWHPDRYGWTVRLACTDAGLTVRQSLIWSKSHFTLGRNDYHWKHEPCLYGWTDGAAHTWLGDRTQTTVLEFGKPVRNDVHPTMKPVELFAHLIGNSCPRSGIVLDPFGGSGTTLIACEQTGCTAHLMELDARYCDTIVRRWEQFAGGKAERHGSKS